MKKTGFVFCVFFLLGGLAQAQTAADAVPATSYFPVLPMDALPDSVPQLVPVAASQPLQGAHSGVTRALIVVHDETRDANGILAKVSALAGTANAETIILAPQFLLPSDLAHFAPHLPDQGRMFAAWAYDGWAKGDDAVAQAGRQTAKGPSSFTVVDLLLMYLSDRGAFPNLKTVTVAGFGLGGAFVQRYAAFGMAYEAVEKAGVSLRYLSAAPGAYLYMTVNRPLGGRKGFGRPDAAACPGFNAYPYGLENLNLYARRAGGNAVKTDYALRFITYLTAPRPDAVPENNCAALAQGADSATRAANYQQYLSSLYGDVAARTQSFVSVKDADNDLIGLFGSACGMAVLFGDGLCLPSWGKM